MFQVLIWFKNQTVNKLKKKVKTLVSRYLRSKEI